MNFNKPIFTIITPTLNNKIELLKTINSIKAQKFNNFEFIVVDGGSTDGTIEVLKESKIITKWISEKDKGIYDAINKGIKFSDGKYINTINSCSAIGAGIVLSKCVQDKVNLYRPGTCGAFPNTGCTEILEGWGSLSGGF